ncbi:GL14767 [Drosophila persimilis]|uniref:GL14767 n=1 Tax=Drosophila persimilis TaxID=7234 RepID=B4GW37_DROPE|nr:GL14767 [Drosophila persimilis]
MEMDQMVKQQEESADLSGSSCSVESKDCGGGGGGGGDGGGVTILLIEDSEIAGQCQSQGSSQTPPDDTFVAPVSHVRGLQSNSPSDNIAQNARAAEQQVAKEPGSHVEE